MSEVSPGADRDRDIESITALLSIAPATSDAATLTDLCARAVDLVADITAVPCVVVRTYEVNSDQFIIRAQRGLSDALLKKIGQVPGKGSTNARAAETLAPVVVPLLEHTDLTWDRTVAPYIEGLVSLVSVPLLTSERIVGTMELASDRPRTWPEAELKWLLLVGQVIGVLISQVELHEQVRELAAVSERARMAQDMHDGTIQTVGTLRLYADGALEALDEGDLDAVRSTLERLEAVAAQAYRELREHLQRLSPRPQSAPNLAGLTRDLVRDYEARWGITATLRLSPRRVGDHPELSLIHI